MRYFIDSSDGGTTWYVMDGENYRIVGAAYMNKYVAQSDADRRNEKEGSA